MKLFETKFLLVAKNTTIKLSELFDAPFDNSSVTTETETAKKRKKVIKKTNNSWKYRLKKFADFIGEEKNLSKALAILWIISIVALLIITAILLFSSKLVFSKYEPGIIVADFFWAVFFGACILIFLAPKVITAVFGSFLGTSLSEVGTASGLVTKANEAITKIAKEVGTTIGSQNSTDPFIALAIWLFVLVVSLLCLPAFFRQE